MKSPSVAVLGAGSWATAVAVHIAAAGNPVMLWGRSPEHVVAMQTTRHNHLYLPGTPFPSHLTVTHDLKACTDLAQEVIIAVPSHAFHELLLTLKQPSHGLSWLTKGLDPKTNQLLSQLVAAQWGGTFPIGIISGPSFAREVAQGLPTALVLASNNLLYSRTIHGLLHQDCLRVYDSNDTIGVQWCGAVKNIIAIACGISDGLNFGSNAKAALITRGLAEMNRMGMQLGGRQETFMGLAGVGDLALTCTDNQSRNRRFGLSLGQGESSVDAERHIGQVVEGKQNAAQVCALAEKCNIEMPICQQVQALLEGKITPKQAVTNLMTRPAKGE
jgi:glycerol-3-phosphate dehydrogenase (NAD(P)+)